MAGWRDHAALGLAGFGCLLGAVALLVASGRAVPPLVSPAAAVPAPLPMREAALPLLAVEILLPHLPRPAPFPRAFAVATALAAEDAPMLRLLLPLADAAAQGAPTPRLLAESLPAAADAAVLAEMGFGADPGWVANRAAALMRLGASLGSAGTPSLSAVQEAAEHLAKGDAASAEAALARLAGPPAEALAPWRAGLARRVAVDAAARQLAALALTRAQEAAR